MKTQNVINRRTRLNKGSIGHSAQKMMKKAKNIEHQIDKRVVEKNNLVGNIDSTPILTMNFQPNYHKDLLETQHMNLNIDDKSIFKDLNLIVNNHGIVSLEGNNGSGKSQFLKKILRSADKSKGQDDINLTNGLLISYLPQEFIGYTGTLKEFALKQNISYENLLNCLKKMGFSRKVFATEIQEMSMGQQKRVVLAKSLIEPANLYLWDEPANYLDIFNQDQLIVLLKEIKPAMLLVEHDIHFIEAVANERVKLKM